ncbi:hypothetical protein WR25_23023 [Diploscapter pachys]|uniref:OmpA-like domain-containing protein n=1 Tax=Diploscapter pachys TaxID=2018661 RepID=A0A2A2KLL2_9BILA|nr:hypothetical protein WR25_23023 [Diploscapter pachys]
MTKLTNILLTGAALASLAACAHKPKQLPPPPVDNTAGLNTAPPANTGPVDGAIVPGSDADFRRSVTSNTVLFGTDQSDIDADARAILDSQAAWMQRYPNVRATIEGHCDERGTRDYNLALGDRRANAAKNYLDRVVQQGSLTRSQERRAATASGYTMLALAALLVVIAVFVIVELASDAMPPILAIVPLLCAIGTVFIAAGFYMLQPNQAGAITLFGSYAGTDRESGLRWVLPWLMRRKVSVRANNVISDRIKVNDLRGNPIEMAAQVVWRVTDTAQALFDVDDYKAFVNVQIEAAVRTIGSRYPYDDYEHQEITLRGNHDQVGAELRAELIARLAVAGITVDECGFTHLAYAQEIAGAMLRRQQAQAVVAARTTLVEGAVGMTTSGVRRWFPT